jgi:hypothetical protein
MVMAEQTKKNSRPSRARTSPRSSAAPSRGSASSRSRRSKRPSSGSSGGNSKRSNKNKSTSGGNGLTDVAKKAKTPALAAGAGLAGLAGGLALAKRTTRKRIFGVRMSNGGAAHAVSKNLAQAAEHVGSFGEGMGSLAAEIRRVREGVALAGEHKRSPIEVVLQGLTRRR